MKTPKEKTAAIKFWLSESILLILSAIYAYAVIGYKTIALVFLSIAFVVALYKIISDYSKKNEKWAKKLKTALSVAIGLGLVCFMAIEIPIVASARTDKNAEAPYLIVLGAGVNGTSPSLSLVNRLTAAKEYLDNYKDAVAVVSGGKGPGEDITEAECMRRWLIENGISEERIIKEANSFSTEDNIRNSLEKIQEAGGDPSERVAIVSSEYHLYRAKYFAREMGANPVGVAAHTSYPILMINYFIREAFAVVYQKIM